MRLRVPVTILSGALLAVACSDSSRSVTQPEAPSFLDVAGAGGSHIHIMPTKAVANGLNDARPGGGGHKQNTGIFYHGGPIIASTNVAAIYWGTSRIYNGGPTPGQTGTANDNSLIAFFINHEGGSPYFNINTTYFDGAGTHVANVVTYAQMWADNSNPGSAPSDAAIQAEVSAGLSSGKLTYDASTLYAVFTGSGVNLGGGFGSQYCAYHGHFSWNGNDVKYAAQPYNYDFPSGCTEQGANTPNGDPAADAEVNTLAHELEETTTDPDLNAWYDHRGQENADKCAWTFGTTYPAGSGVANMNLGGKDFLIQRNWVNAGSGGCAVGYP
jgi:hypothetical protein